MRYTIYAVLITFLALTPTEKTSAQASLTAAMNDSTGKALAGANVLLLSGMDSMLVKGTVTDKTGRFIIDRIVKGKYILCCTFSGYHPAYASVDIDDHDTKNIGTITLITHAQQMNDVTVTAYKPLFEQRTDMTIVNVKNSITSAGA